MLNEILSVILGFAVGDALGVPMEFKSRDYLAHNPVKGMQEYGTHNQPAGTWSDDTSMTLCLLESLSRGLYYNDIADNFIKWKDNAFLTATGTVFDIGNTTVSSLLNYAATRNALASGLSEENSNGNGSLMRVAPIAFYANKLSTDERRTMTFNISSITHAHMRSKLACWFYVEILVNLLAEMPKDKAVDTAFLTVYNWAAAQKLSREFRHYKRCTAKIAELSVKDIRSSGYVVDTMEAALWSFLKSTDYKSAVLTAVSLGDDTDTIAAITGSLAGLFYGLESIPAEWLSVLKKAGEIRKLCEAFAASLKQNRSFNSPLS